MAENVSGGQKVQILSSSQKSLMSESDKKKQKREIVSLQKLIDPVAAFSAFLTAAENVRDDWFVYLALFDKHSSENIFLVAELS